MSQHHNMGSKKKRNAMRTLHEIQGGCCAFCRFAVVHPDSPDRPHPEDDLAPSLEHVIPRSRRGSNALTNLLLAHRGCNGERGAGRLPPNALAMWKSNLVAHAARAAGATERAA
jgi:5-methylcytosine-specific restriction endonuclease McrA